MSIDHNPAFGEGEPDPGDFGPVSPLPLGDAAEAAEDDAGAFGTMVLRGARKFKKKPVLTLDPEEEEKAHRLMEMNASSLVEAADPVPRPDKPAGFLGLDPVAAMETEDDSEGGESLDEGPIATEPLFETGAENEDPVSGQEKAPAPPRRKPDFDFLSQTPDAGDEDEDEDEGGWSGLDQLLASGLEMEQRRASAPAPAPQDNAQQVSIPASSDDHQTSADGAEKEVEPAADQAGADRELPSEDTGAEPETGWSRHGAGMTSDEDENRSAADVPPPVAHDEVPETETQQAEDISTEEPQDEREHRAEQPADRPEPEELATAAPAPPAIPQGSRSQLRAKLLRQEEERPARKSLGQRLLALLRAMWPF